MDEIKRRESSRPTFLHSKDYCFLIRYFLYVGRLLARRPLRERDNSMSELAIKTGLADINGAPLYYEVAGAGHPLVLLHAGVADRRMWDDQFAAFASQYQVIRYDLRGFGLSSVPTTPFASHQELAELLASLGIAHSHVLGISYRGKIALDF